MFCWFAGSLSNLNVTPQRSSSSVGTTSSASRGKRPTTPSGRTTPMNGRATPGATRTTPGATRTTPRNQKIGFGSGTPNRPMRFTWTVCSYKPSLCCDLYADVLPLLRTEPQNKQKSPRLECVSVTQCARLWRNVIGHTWRGFNEDYTACCHICLRTNKLSTQVVHNTIIKGTIMLRTYMYMYVLANQQSTFFHKHFVFQVMFDVFLLNVCVFWGVLYPAVRTCAAQFDSCESLNVDRRIAPYCRCICW